MFCCVCSDVDVESSLMNSSITLVKVFGKIGKFDDPCVFDLIDRIKEEFAIFGTTLHLCRKLKGKYSHLCSKNVKYTSYLFRNDVPETVEIIAINLAFLFFWDVPFTNIVIWKYACRDSLYS